jgi:hypothetical protein
MLSGCMGGQAAQGRSGIEAGAFYQRLRSKGREHGQLFTLVARAG